MKLRIIRTALTLGVTLSLAGNMFAQGTTIVVTDATPAVTFLETVTDARSAAMGGMNSVVSPGHGGAQGNHSANLFSSGSFGANVSMASRQDFSGNTLYSAGAFYNIGGRHGIGAGFRYVPMARSSSDVAIDLGYGIRLGGNFSISLTGRFVSSTLEDATAGAAAFDLGAYYEKGFTSGGKWALGVQLYNVGLNKLVYGGVDRYSMPGKIRLGASAGMPMGGVHSITGTLNAAYRIIPSDASGFELGAGAEYGFRGMAFARVGFHLGDSLTQGNFATVGAGVAFYGIRLDAAYWLAVADSDLKNILFFSLGAMF